MAGINFAEPSFSADAKIAQDGSDRLTDDASPLSGKAASKAVSTSDRLLQLLSLFSTEHPEWTVEEVAEDQGLALSTAYRYVKSLSDAGLIVAYSPGRYVLGPAIIQYDRLMRLLDPLITSAQSVMAQLVDSMPPQHIMLLCRLYRKQVMCVHQEFTERPDFAVSYERGRPMPLLRGAASKIILAHLPSRTVRGIFEADETAVRNARLGSSWDEMKRSLREIRSAGICVTVSELDRDLRGVSVPILSPEREILGSLSIVAPLSYDKQFGLADSEQALRSGRAQIETGLALLAAATRTVKAAAKS
jgi:DNA-binding IclR family transcriptional regulator